MPLMNTNTQTELSSVSERTVHDICHHRASVAVDCSKQMVRQCISCMEHSAFSLCETSGNIMQTMDEVIHDTVCYDKESFTCAGNLTDRNICCTGSKTEGTLLHRRNNFDHVLPKAIYDSCANLESN